MCLLYSWQSSQHSDGLIIVFERWFLISVKYLISNKKDSVFYYYYYQYYWQLLKEHRVNSVGPWWACPSFVVPEPTLLIGLISGCELLTHWLYHKPYLTQGSLVWKERCGHPTHLRNQKAQLSTWLTPPLKAVSRDLQKESQFNWDPRPKHQKQIYPNANMAPVRASIQGRKLLMAAPSSKLWTSEVW